MTGGGWRFSGWRVFSEKANRLLDLAVNKEGAEELFGLMMGTAIEGIIRLSMNSVVKQTIAIV